MDFRDYLNKLEDISVDHEPMVGDIVEIELGDTLVETYIEDITEDGVIIKVDETALRLMIDGKKQLDEACWKGYHKEGNKELFGKTVPNCVKNTNESEELDEGSYKQMMHDDAEKMSLEAFLERWCHNKEDEDFVKEFWHNVNGDEEEVDEAKYQGREVPLNKPMAGDVKKSKVYVKKPNGKVVKVNFGDKKMRIKKSNPKRRKSFRARHRCENPGPKWKARYWSCRAW